MTFKHTITVEFRIWDSDIDYLMLHATKENEQIDGRPNYKVVERIFYGLAGGVGEQSTLEDLYSPGNCDDAWADFYEGISKLYGKYKSPLAQLARCAERDQEDDAEG